jgi:outer membrane protein assembly factor BamB
MAARLARAKPRKGMIRCRVPHRGRLLNLFPILLLAAPARGADEHPDVLSGENRAAAIRLAEARKRLDDRQWSEAIEQLQSILNSSGNDLVPLTPAHSLRAGRLCHLQLAALPAEALRLYRQRYEDQARKKLDRAQAERDVAQLRKLVEDSFCTHAAEKAIDLLGDLAFERGRFEEAEEWWRILSPLTAGRRNAALPPADAALVYPDPSIDPARSQAKQLLARLFQDAASDSPAADSGWMADLKAYRQRHPKAEGTLAGRKGRYADVLQATADARRKQGGGERENWPTFGGDLSRGRPIPAAEDILDRLSALCREGPTWRFDLEQRKRVADAEPSSAVNAAQARTLAFHPVIAGHQVLIADAQYVSALDLRNGQSQQWYDAAQVNGGVEPNLNLPAPPDLRYTLTVADGNAYARLGAQDIGVGAAAKPKRPDETFLACLGLQPDDKGKHFRWQIRGVAHSNAVWEGAPLSAGGMIWIAATFSRNNRSVSAIDCYSADDTSEPPLRWRCEVCETSEIKAGEPRYRHHLLTLAGTQIVYCAHNGAVVAIDALTGRRNWAIRYPRRMSDAEETELRDLAPVLFAAGRLYVAPADSDSLLCLDAANGRTIWELEPVRVVHLLGIGEGRLIFTTPTGLRAVRADNGNPVWAVPDIGGLTPAGRGGKLLGDVPLGSSGLTPAGRGLLIGDMVLFPTTQLRDPGLPSLATVVYAIRQSDGRPAADPALLHRLPAGNLAYANGCLAVADRKTLSVFVPPRLLLDRRKGEVLRRPYSAAALLDLARAEADAGHDREAMQMFGSVEALLSNDAKTSAEKKLLAKSLTAKQDLLLKMAQRSAEGKNWREAEKSLEQAAAVPLPPRYRLHALLRAAQIWQDAKQADRVKAIQKAIQADETLRTIATIDRQGRPIAVAASGSLAGQRPSEPLAATKGRIDIPPLPLFRSWHARLGGEEWILAGWEKCDTELLLTGSTDGRFICRRTSDGETLWTQRLPFAPRWAGCRANTLLAAGEEGVACLRRDNGELFWHLPAPAFGRYPRAASEDVCIVLDPQPPEPLTAFRLSAGRLFFLQGQRRLFAVNADTGAVLWDRWAPDGQLRLPFPLRCFSPCYHAGAEIVLIQMSGRRWLLDAATGRRILQATDSRGLWQRPPLELDEHTLGLIPDYRSIVLLDARTGHSLWTHRLAGDTTSSGEMPSLLGRGDLLLCVQPANVGYYLQRLDRFSGKFLWPRPRLLTAKTLDPSAWTFDAEAVYSIEDRSLIARSLTDGQIRWQRPLPSAAWKARRVGDYLAVSPQAFGAEMRFRFHSPLGAVQWHLDSLLAPEAICPVSCYDPKTGQLIQRWHFRLQSPVRTTLDKRFVREEGGRVRILRTSSLLASEHGPVIRLDSPRPFVAVGGEVWGLSATLNDKRSTASAAR